MAKLVRALIAVALVALVSHVQSSSVPAQRAVDVQIPTAAEALDAHRRADHESQEAADPKADRAQTDATSDVVTASNERFVPTSEQRRAREPFANDTLLVRSDLSAGEIERMVTEAGGRYERPIPEIGFHVVGADEAALDTVSYRLSTQDGVAAVEPNGRRYAFEVPNDDYLDSQWNLHATRFMPAWDLTHGSETVDIAVIDTAVQLDAAAYAGRITATYDALAGEYEWPNGCCEHGTMVTSLLASKTNDGIGMAGTAWNGRFMVARAIDADNGGTDATVIASILWAADNGAEVINMSLGGPAPSTALKTAIDYAVAKGIVVVAAAGNDGTDRPMYPAAYGNVIAVGASDFDGNVALWSSRGQWVDVIAPGYDVMTMAKDYGLGEEPSFSGASGTSFAAPLVAAAAGLVRSQHPTWTAGAIMNRISQTASDRGPPGIDDHSGHGMLDVYAAVGGRTAGSPGFAQDAREPDDVPFRAKPIAAAAQATIVPEGDADWFTYAAPGSGTIYLDVSPPEYRYPDPSGMDVVVEAYGPGNRYIGRIDRWGVGAWEDVWVATSGPGTYAFKVTNGASSSVRRPYTVTPAFSSEVVEGFDWADEYWTGSNAKSTAVGDVTGDGRDDVLVATSFYFDDANDGRLFVFPQTPDGDLAAPVKHTLHAMGGGGIAIADIDGDGDNDVAVASGAGVELLMQTDGILGDPTVLSAAEGASIVRIADLNGDGAVDIVAGGYERTVAILRVEDGWEPHTVYEGRLQGLEVGDLDGDEYPDIAGAVWVGVTPLGTPPPQMALIVLHQQPDDTFVTTEHRAGFGSEMQSLEDVEIVDVNDDQRDDVIAVVPSNRPASQVKVWTQTAAGGLSDASTHPSYDLPYSIRSADMDGGNGDEIVVAHSAWDAVGVYHQLPGGGLTDEELWYVPHSYFQTESLSLGDTNSDGRRDIVVPGSSNAYVSVLEQLGSPHRKHPAWVTSTSPAALDRSAPTSVVPSVTFGRSVDQASITASSVRLVDGESGSPVTISRTYDAASKRLDLKPTTALVAGRAYVVTVDGLRDSAGFPMSDRFTSRFTVAKPASARTLDSDFDGDGYDDVVIGTPREDLGAAKDGGVVHVLYGSVSGPSSRSVMLSQDSSSVAGVAETGDLFGAAFASGDLNADGYDDLAIGSPGESVGAASRAGMVHVFHGSPIGLRTSGSQMIAHEPESGDFFGSSLTWGNFDTIAGDELAVSGPGESIGDAFRAGMVHVFPSRSSSLDVSAASAWTMNDTTPGVTAAAADHFGMALAAGDLDADGLDDLAIGAPGHDYATFVPGDGTDLGSVAIVRGTTVGPRYGGSIRADIDRMGFYPRGFGTSLAIADVGGSAQRDGFPDLIAGATNMRALVLFGSAAASAEPSFRSFNLIGNQRPVQALDPLYPSGTSTDPPHGFGRAVAAATGRNGSTVVVVGAPAANDAAGRVELYVAGAYLADKGVFGLAKTATLRQGSQLKPGAAEPNDRTGTALSMGDWDGNSKIDAAVGAPGEALPSKSAAGVVHVVRDVAGQRLSSSVSQDSTGIAGAAEAGDAFGASLEGSP